MKEALGVALVRVRRELRLTQSDLGRRVRVHRKTVAKWESGRRVPTPILLQRLVQALYAVDVAGARRVAEAAGQTVEGLGIVEVSASLRQAGDSVLCAGAEVLDGSPRALRPALLAALRRVRELGLTLAMVEQALAVE